MDEASGNNISGMYLSVLRSGNNSNSILILRKWKAENI